MTFVAWRLPVAVLALLMAAVLLLGGFVIEGAVVAAVAVLWFVERARVPESLGVRFLHRRAELELAKMAALIVLLLAALGATALAFVLGWNHDTEGPILIAALCGLMVMLMQELERRSDAFDRYMDGGNAEVLVHNELHRLPPDWVKEDNWLRDDGRGNVDHIVGRPDGTWFAIETKSGRFRHGDASQAVGCAVAVQKARALKWVTPVLCVGDAGQITTERVVGRATVWVVDRQNLFAFLVGFESRRR